MYPIAAFLGIDFDKIKWDEIFAVVTEKGISAAHGLVTAAVIVIAGRFLIGMICRTLQKHLNRSNRVSDLMEEFMVNSTRRVLWIVVIMIALKPLGIDTSALIAGLGVGGFIIGFAFQETLGNLASGFMIALNQPFTLKDFVDVGGHKGTVSETNMMATTLLTLDNKKVIIPNKGVWGSAIVNYTALKTRRVDMVVGVSYGADLNKTKQVILSTVKSIDKVLADPAVQVEVTEMADSSVNFVVRPWCKTADYWDVYFQAHHKIKEALDAAGIEIPFPQRDVHHYGLAPNLLETHSA